MEDTDNIVMVNKTGSSCVTKFDEVVPLDRAASDFICSVVKVKQEDVQDIKVDAVSEDYIDQPYRSDFCCPQDFICPVVEVRQEDLQHVKVEIADDIDVKYPVNSAKLESSFVQSGATNSHFPVEVTDGHMRPVVVFEKLNPARINLDVDVEDVLAQAMCLYSEKNLWEVGLVFAGRRPLKPKEKKHDVHISTGVGVYCHPNSETDEVATCSFSDNVSSVQFVNSNGRENFHRKSSNLKKDADGRLFECKICNKSFRRKDDLERHVRIHSDHRPFVCEVCKSSFKRADHLKKHMLVHSWKRPFSCLLCTRDFVQKSHLNRHISTCNGFSRVNSTETNEAATNSLSEDISILPQTCDSFLQVVNSNGSENLHQKSSNLENRTHSYVDNRRFGCKDCSRTFQRKEGLERHVRIHSGSRPFVCEICKSSFKRADHLKNHMLVHSRRRPFSCMMCTSTFASSCDLKRHLCIHSDKRSFRCMICYHTFVRKSDLKRHTWICKGHSYVNSTATNEAAVHSLSDNVSRLQQACENSVQIVNSNYSENFQQKSSNLKKHTDKLPFECKICNKSFQRKDDLERHIRIHSGHRPFACEVCKRSFKRADHLKKHMVVHTRERPFYCMICSSDFMRKSDLNRHISICKGFSRVNSTETNEAATNSLSEDISILPQTCDSFLQVVSSTYSSGSENFRQNSHSHPVRQPSECKVCYRSFQRKEGLERHVRVHSGHRPFTCEACKSCFKRADHLKKHMIVHTRERPFPCMLCKSNFASSCDLKRHLRIHNFERSFCCTICASSFACASNLTRHIKRLHTHQRPFSCEICDSTFVQKSDLKRHMYVHKGHSHVNCHEANEGATHSLSDNMPETCVGSIQVVNSSDHLTADASNQLHAAEDCKQSCTAVEDYDTVANVENNWPVKCEIDNENF